MTVIRGLIFVPDRPCAADPELFFSVGRLRIEAAKRICSGCPYRDPCRATAQALDQDYGVWGGVSDEERRAERQSRPGRRRHTGGRAAA